MEQKPPRLLQEPNGKWYVFYSDNGRSKRRSLRTTDLQIAKKRFHGWLKHKALGQVVKDPTIAFCLDKWFEDWIRGRMASEVRYHAIIKNLNAYFGNMKVSEIKREHSRKYIEMRFAGLIGSSKGATGTVRGELQRLRACFRFFVERVEPKEQRLKQEMIPYVELPPESPPRERVLDEDEVQLIRDYCGNLVINGPGRRPSNRMSRVGRFVMIALETAQRKTAILELKWDQVDFDKNLINFNPVGRQQTIKRRPTVPISPILLPVLKRAKEEAINANVMDTTTDIYDQVSNLAKTLEIEGLHPHVFRHTWATRAVMRGVPIKKVAKFMGDSEETVRKTYEHLSPHYLNDVFETTDNIAQNTAQKNVVD